MPGSIFCKPGSWIGVDHRLIVGSESIRRKHGKTKVFCKEIDDELLTSLCERYKDARLWSIENSHVTRKGLGYLVPLKPLNLDLARSEILCSRLSTRLNASSVRSLALVMETSKSPGAKLTS